MDMDRSRALAKKPGLTFPLLADPTRKTIVAWGLEDRVNETAWPGTFVIDRTRRIRWRNVSRTYPERPRIADLVTAIGTAATP